MIIYIAELIISVKAFANTSKSKVLKRNRWLASATISAARTLTVIIECDYTGKVLPKPIALIMPKKSTAFNENMLNMKNNSKYNKCL